MDTALGLIGIELVVEDLDRAVELFAEVMGCTLLSRGASALIGGEGAGGAAGPILISLLAPVSSGPGARAAERNPRLSQMIFGSPDEGGTTATFDRAVTA